mmetsp:Transcript_3969/g.5854  ORF Transcript_3969/g.5854 Transcript_3969/m.5854 type:complete len:570 (+) Transcript_3969:39-1748(+)
MEKSNKQEKKRPTKYVLVTGGVLSGLGKGIIASSTGRLMKLLGFNVTAIKIDPYINIDAGTMSPIEHGEVYVLDDGGEVDLDLGNYERFMDVKLKRFNNITTGKIYQSVIDKERKGDYLGKTVQVVPHIVDEIQLWVERVAEESKADICIIELGGTVGDIESMPFIEALRQLQFRVGRQHFCNIHVSLVPVISAVGEQKTKPTQAAVRSLRMYGIDPDLIICRSEKPVTESVKQKISQFCHVPVEHVLGCHNVPNIYHVTVTLTEQNMNNIIMKCLQLQSPYNIVEIGKHLEVWRDLVKRSDAVENQSDDESLRLAFVGKYCGLKDSYLSVIKAVNHASYKVGRRVQLVWIAAEDLEVDDHPTWDDLKRCDCGIILGGFGKRGVEGKIAAAKYFRVNKVPFLGICLGMQLAVVEYARHVLNIPNACSQEFTDDPESTNVHDHHAVIFMPDYTKDGKKGGNMRLGDHDTYIKYQDTIYAHLHNYADKVRERHRHRFEVNIDFVKPLEDAGLRFVGQDITKTRQEVIELVDHPFYIGVQYHPEFTSRPYRPNPLFVGLISTSNLLKFKNDS